MPRLSEVKENSRREEMVAEICSAPLAKSQNVSPMQSAGNEKEATIGQTASYGNFSEHFTRENDVRLPCFEMR